MKSLCTEPVRIQPLRSKRKESASAQSTGLNESAQKSIYTTEFHGSKRLKARMQSDCPLDFLNDKENFHRSRPLAPRSRPARVLLDLVVDLPTDCSDFEVSMDEEDSSPTGYMFNEQQRRMADPSNKQYHFSVYEDPIERSN